MTARLLPAIGTKLLREGGNENKKAH